MIPSKKPACRLCQGTALESSTDELLGNESFPVNPCGSTNLDVSCEKEPRSVQSAENRVVADLSGLGNIWRRTTPALVSLQHMLGGAVENDVLKFIQGVQ